MVRGADLLGSWKSSYNLQLTVYPRVLHICCSAPADSTNHRCIIVVFTTEKKKLHINELKSLLVKGQARIPLFLLVSPAGTFLRVWWEVAVLRTAGAG